MKFTTNPFTRGYTQFSYRRVLLVTYADDCPPSYQTLHSSQEHLQNHQIQLSPCVFCDSFSLILEGQTVPEELSEQCQSSGQVSDVLYEVRAVDDGKLIHIGDTPTAEGAQALIDLLSFQTGHYSRSWEISTFHIAPEAFECLQMFAESSTHIGLNFECFLLTDSDSVGCKLYETPWTDENLLMAEGITADELRQQQLDAGLPESLVNVLFLAGQADVRFLVFDPHAHVLEGLPLLQTPPKRFLVEPVATQFFAL